MRRDKHAQFRFAPLQSAAAAALLKARGARVPAPDEPLDTMMVIDGDQVLVRSDAALRIARGLPFPWPMIALCRLVPRRWRDAVYRFVAERRYGWFGRSETCLVPTPDVRRRLVPGADAQAANPSA